MCEDSCAHLPYSIVLLCLVLSMETLSEMFELEIPTVHSIISKMIINEELMVSFTPAQFYHYGSRGDFICFFKHVRIVIKPLCPFPSGIAGPAHTDCGDAPHGAHVPAEHGPAAG